MAKAHPKTARGIRALREGEGMTVAQACEAMRAHTNAPLPTAESVERRWKPWEYTGKSSSHSDERYRPLIAAALGIVTTADSRPRKRPSDYYSDVPAATEYVRQFRETLTESES